MEYYKNTNIKLEYKQSGLFDGLIGKRKRFLQLGTIAGTLATGYGTALSHISYKDSLKTSEELKNLSTLNPTRLIGCLAAGGRLSFGS
jgi:hypothetical protein